MHSPATGACAALVPVPGGSIPLPSALTPNYVPATALSLLPLSHLSSQRHEQGLWVRSVGASRQRCLSLLKLNTARQVGGLTQGRAGRPGARLPLSLTGAADSRGFRLLRLRVGGTTTFSTPRSQLGHRRQEAGQRTVPPGSWPPLPDPVGSPQEPVLCGTRRGTEVSGQQRDLTSISTGKARLWSDRLRVLPRPLPWPARSRTGTPQAGRLSGQG